MKSGLKGNENLASGHRQRIKQRFLEYGSDMLAEYEKLELFLTLCIARKDVKPIAKNLLNTFGSINDLLDANDKDLLGISGVGESVICNIKILRMCLESCLAQRLKQDAITLDKVELLAKYFKKRISHLDYEVLEMICLDSQLNLLGNSAIRIFEGNIASVEIDIRKIIEIALKKSATSIVIAHNHPNGDAKPSQADLKFTKTLANICKAINLDFIEHIIIAKNKFYSFRRNAHLDILYDPSLEKEEKIKVASPKKILSDL